MQNYIPKQLKNLTENKFDERLNNIITPEKTKQEALSLFGKVYLVGCGTGDPDLLTIKAYKIISSADVVLYDSLISKDIYSNLNPLNHIINN